MSPTLETSVLIIGTGIAGLSSALKLADQLKVILVCKDVICEGSTRYAQGGIASVWSKNDSFQEHIEDTLKAGAGLCHSETVKLCVEEGPKRIEELISWGVQFTKAPQSLIDPTIEFDLHREGGHGQRRILHADDLTGLAIEKALMDQIQLHPNIHVLEHHIAIDLITEGKILREKRSPGRCLGAYILNTLSQKVLTVRARATILATGGAGKVYLYTSNPDTCTGDGIAMAHRAGARVANLEFMQFHPTCLYHPTARTFLISEALRGEGAILRTLQGDNFMPHHHPLGSLAPRDTVARAIDMEMKKTGDKHVLLDCSPIPTIDIEKKFPNIFATCLSYGIDMRTTSIPVVPAAHYTCGGVLVNEHAQTDIEALYAVGEVACTGFHGANRLASNSLLEAVVFSHRLSEHILQKIHSTNHSHVHALFPKPIPEWDPGQAVQLEEKIDIAANWLEIRSLMWNYVGIVRSNRRLERAKRRLNLLQAEIQSYYWDFVLTKDVIELRNLLTVAQLIVTCAQSRKESRGLHYTVDYPRIDSHFSENTIL